MKYLFLSQRNGLVPFAYYFARRGLDVDLVVWKGTHEASLAGLPGGPNRPEVERQSAGGLPIHETLDRYRELEPGSLTVVTDLPSAHRVLGEGPRYFDTNGEPLDNGIQVGGWWSGGRLRLEHLLVVDVGAWTGGMGPRIDGGMSLVWPVQTPDLAPLQAQLAPLLGGFTGLVRFELSPGEGGLEVGRLQLGWTPLHTHLFLAELEGSQSLLEGSGEAKPRARFLTAVPVSVPPWPNPGRGAEGHPIQLTEQQLSQFFWHDARRGEGKQLVTAGLDGLVGVAVGSALNPLGARLKALALAEALDLPEKQFRADAGARVPEVVAAFEEQFGVVL